MQTYLFDVSFHWIGRCGTQHQTIEAPDAMEAKKRFLAMYGDKVDMVIVTKIR